MKWYQWLLHKLLGFDYVGLIPINERHGVRVKRVFRYNAINSRPPHWFVQGDRCYDELGEIRLFKDGVALGSPRCDEWFPLTPMAEQYFDEGFIDG
jgi:hypothetical protein